MKHCHAHTPQATLFNDDDKQITTHVLSPNPDEGGRPVPRGSILGTPARYGP